MQRLPAPRLAEAQGPSGLLAGAAIDEADARAHGARGLCRGGRVAGRGLPDLCRGRHGQGGQGGGVAGAGALRAQRQAAVSGVSDVQACGSAAQSRVGAVGWGSQAAAGAQEGSERCHKGRVRGGTRLAAGGGCSRRLRPSPEYSRQQRAQGTAVQMTMASPSACARCASVCPPPPSALLKPRRSASQPTTGAPQAATAPAGRVAVCQGQQQAVGLPVLPCRTRHAQASQHSVGQGRRQAGAEATGQALLQAGPQSTGSQRAGPAFKGSVE